jgi:hypothetical protein
VLLNVGELKTFKRDFVIPIRQACDRNVLDRLSYLRARTGGDRKTQEKQMNHETSTIGITTEGLYLLSILHKQVINHSACTILYI